MTETWAIYIGCLILSLIPVIWILSGKFNLNSLHNIFTCVWFYYMLSVPLDLTLGLEIRHVANLPDLNSLEVRPFIFKIFLQYLIFGLGYFLIFNLIPGKIPSKPFWKTDKVYIPPFWAMLLINICCFALYMYFFGDVRRDERALLTEGSLPLKLFTVGVSLVKAMNIIYIHCVNDKKKALWLVLVSFLFTFGSGGRTEIVLFALVYIVRYQVRFSRAGIMAFALVLSCFFLFWKGWWSAAHNYFNSGRVVTDFSVDYPSISRIEGVGPYEISVDLMLHHNHSPLLLGDTYVVSPLQTLFPRFLSPAPMQTLAEYYGTIFRPAFTARGGGMGFSAMGEAWLNFSYFGPFLVGLFAAIIIKYFDTTPRGLFYWVMLMMVFRFFRTDTASLFKSWFVVQGGTILIVLISLKFIWDLRELLKVERQSKGYTAND